MPGQSKYLLFFHSRTPNMYCPPWSSYYMGALIFTASLPFTIESISRVPLYHPSWYQGAWENRWWLEYVYFPMNFFFIHLPTGLVYDDIDELDCGDSLTCMSRYNVTLTYGQRDDEGHMLTMNLYHLHQTLHHHHFH
jgi:hypothetical protein